MASPLRYRPEIDGLRALAVLPVVLFHAGFSLFAGGFVGVDVFFVISGYLITSIILSEQAAGNFSIVRFYERRARRILPALFLVMFCCLPFAFLWLWPGDLKEFSQSVSNTSIFISNVLFERKSGYFDSAAAFKPLLHTWSLSVEEQYYLLFPPLVLLITWRWAKNLPKVLAAIALLSLAWANYEVRNDSGAAYFLLQSRMWELMIGSLLACYHQRHPFGTQQSTWRNAAGSLLGLALILCSIFYYNETVPYPSLYTLAPTLGAALILACASPHNVVGKLLALKPFVFIGLISYSVYLWHQPVFVFARTAGYAEAGAGFFAALSVLVIILGYLSWRWVETPFRTPGKFSRKQVFVFALLGSLFFIGVSEIGKMNKGKIRPMTDAQEEIYAYKKYEHAAFWREGECFLKPEQTYTDFGTDCTHYDANRKITVWGDSYAAALTAGLRVLEPELTQLTANRCPPLMAEYSTIERKHCTAINRYVFNQIIAHPPEILILHANWMFYQLDKPAPYLQKTIVMLREKLPQTRIYVLGNLPQWSPSLPDVMLRNKLSLETAKPLKNGGLARLKPYDADLQTATEAGGAIFLSAVDAMCTNSFCITTATWNGKTELATWDYGHPTVPGSIWLLEHLLQHELK